MTGWKAVYVAGTDYEADLVCLRLRDRNIPAVVLNQRDHAWNLNLGYLAKVRVFVQDNNVALATRLLEEEGLFQAKDRDSESDDGVEDIDGEG